jgi:DNA-binding CsgD family transcriptional regulator
MADGLLEREGPLRVFADALAAAREGTGGTVLVEGEAGSGKTSLVRAAVGGATTWWGWCDPLATPRPLGPLLDIAPVAGITVHDDLFTTYDAVLAAARREPVVIVVEDLHWADDATLTMVQYLGRRVAFTRAVLVVTYRGDEVGPALRRVLGDIVRHAAHRIAVAPLSLAAVTELTTGVGLDPAEVCQVTGGNAFYVTEVIAAGGGVPASVADAVLARVARLPADAQAAVEFACIEPGGMEEEYVAGTQSTDGVLVTVGGVVRFRHELARRAVYDALPVSRRRDLHRAMLALLADSTDLARKAHHAVGAEDPDTVVQFVRPAADGAIRSGANRQAESFLTRMLVHRSRLDPGEVVALQVDLGRVLIALDRPDEAVTALRGAEADTARLPDPRPRGLALAELSRALWTAGEVAAAAVARDDAVAVLRPLGPTRELAAALVLQGRGRMLARLHEPALTSIREGAAVAAQLADDAIVLSAQIVEGATELVTGEPETGVAILTAARDRAHSLGNRPLEVDAIRMLGSGAGEARRYDAAFAWAGQIVTHSAERDNDYEVGYMRAWQARMRLEQGAWDDAADLAVLALDVGSAPVIRSTALSVLGRLRVRRGDPHALEPLAEVEQLATRLELQHVWPGLCAVAERCWLSGEPEAGAAALAAAYEQALGTDSPWAQGEIGYWLWRTGGLEHAPNRAAAPYAAAIAGDWRAAADAFAGLGNAYEQALSLVDGDETAARAGVAILDRLGARPAAARARRDLAERGISVPGAPRRSTTAHAQGLTRREAEIHELLAQGLDNGHIARQLYISRRTVEHHVSAVLRKTGAASRDELAP